MATYVVSCTCGAVSMRLEGEPRVRGHCHCNACRTLLDTPYHSVNAWNPEQVTITKGDQQLVSFEHPDLTMKKVYCAACGDVLYNTNKMDWRVVSQHLMARNNGGALQDELQSKSHFHYANRIVDVEDDLPKRD